MVQVTARLPDALSADLDAAAQQLNRCRADIIRQAIEYYLDDIESALRRGCPEGSRRPCARLG
jgi:transposase